MLVQCTSLVMTGAEVRFPAQLLESRAVRNSQWVSQGFGGRTRVGAARSESHDVMRTLDEGEFVVASDRAFFVGRLAQRVWEYSKVLSVNWDTDTLAIAVSNRQKVSGVRFEGPVVEMFNLALARWRQGHE